MTRGGFFRIKRHFTLRGEKRVLKLQRAYKTDYARPLTKQLLLLLFFKLFKREPKNDIVRRVLRKLHARVNTSTTVVYAIYGFRSRPTPLG